MNVELKSNLSYFDKEFVCLNANNKYKETLQQIIERSLFTIIKSLGLRVMKLLEDPNITKEDFDYLKSLVKSNTFDIKVLFGEHKLTNSFNYDLGKRNCLEFNTYEEYKNYLDLVSI
jgi:hypothetical protein